ncbi:MAG: NAD-dependent epimerase/dehydratase family protein, partial [Rhodospirillaceae bacterium]
AVLDAARRRRTPVVYASSAAVYGCNPRCPLDETAAPLPLSAYGADKLGCELHAAVAGHAHGVPTTGFRFFNVYGPRQNPLSPYSGVISIFCDRLLAGRSLTVYGDGEQVRDFVYVDDVVRFLIAAMEHPSVRPQVFNVCTGKPTSIRALAGLLADALGVRPSIETGPERPGDIRVSVGDPTAAGRAFGMAASTDLRTGLARTATSLKARTIMAPAGLPN